MICDGFVVFSQFSSIVGIPCVGSVLEVIVIKGVFAARTSALTKIDCGLSRTERQSSHSAFAGGFKFESMRFWITSRSRSATLRRTGCGS